MDDKQQCADFSLEYREHPKFKGIDSNKAKAMFPAYVDILDTAESLLFRCSPHEIIDLSEHIDSVISEHHDAICLGERQTQLPNLQSVDGPRKALQLKDAAAHFANQHYASSYAQNRLFTYDAWTNMFPVLALANLADAAQYIDRSEPDILSASNAIVDAMDLVQYGVLMTMAEAFHRDKHRHMAPKRASDGKRLIGASTRKKIADEERAKIQAERSAMLAIAGLHGAQSRNRPFEALKRWALEQAVGMHGAHKQIARKLSAVLPKHLADISQDPERLIYEALRSTGK